MNATPAPGLRNQSGTRTVFRIVGVIAVLSGLALVGYGFAMFASGIFSDDMPDDSQMGRSFLLFALGGVMLVAGFVLSNLGFMGAAARYGAGETMPVVKDSAAYLTDGAGLLGIGRTIDDPTSASGHDCPRCGVGNDEGARYCDACGSALG